MGDIHLGQPGIADGIGHYDYLIKLLALGDSDVGKTSLLLRFVDDVFDAEIGTTIGVDFKEKVIDKGGKKVYLQLWDTAGQERYQSVTTAFFRNAFGFMVVFDLTKQQTFVNCRNWIAVLSQHSELDNPDMILVGNKFDLLAKREVTASQAQELAKQYNMDYVETSAKDGTNVQQMMDKLIDRVTVTMEKEMKRINKNKTRTDSPAEKPGGKCCLSS